MIKFTPPPVFGKNQEADEHDEIVRLIAAQQSALGTSREAFYNVNNKRNNPLTVNKKTFYPDVIICKFASRDQPIAICEVKTANDFNKRSIQQLLTYASFGLEFHVYIPASSLEKVEKLCVKHHIRCSLGTYVRVKTFFSSKWVLKFAVRDLRGTEQ